MGSYSRFSKFSLPRQPGEHRPPDAPPTPVDRPTQRPENAILTTGTIARWQALHGIVFETAPAEAGHH
jgi:hypothetical protein